MTNFVIDPENVEEVDENLLSIALSSLIIKRDAQGVSKIVPFLLKMSEKKVKTIWVKIQPFITFDEKKWFRDFIRNF